MHSNKRILPILVSMLVLCASYQFRRIDYREARLKNVCKDLRGDVLLYFIFIDTKSTTPWTEFDIESTIDSVRTAINWLHLKARESHISLNIRADFYIGSEYTTIRRNLPGGSVYTSLTRPSFRKGLENINRWADGVARIAGKSVTLPDKDGIPDIKNPNNAERLIAFLRDENHVESVALMFFVNNYYQSDISVPLNTYHTGHVEFAIVSYKYASDIAHNLLHLYGAADMHETPYRRSKSRIRSLASLYPDDIMQDPRGKYVGTRDIGDYTRYLIGWTDELDASLEPLMKDRTLNH